MEKEKVGVGKVLFHLLLLLAAGICFVPLYILWKVYVFIVSLFRFKAFRLSGKEFQLPVIHYQHPRTRKKIIFVAVMHVAEEQYFSALTSLVASFPGYKVLFEMITALTPEQEAKLTENELGIRAYFKNVADSMTRLGAILSLQHQKKGLAYPPEWINTDLSMYDFIKLYSSNGIKVPAKKDKIEKIFKSEYELLIKWLVNKAINRFIPLLVAVFFFGRFLKSSRLKKKIILDTRNAKALQGIDENSENDIITIWGAAHLQGIDKGLRLRGFQEIERHWLAVYHVRDYSLLDALKSMSDSPALKTDKASN